MSGTAAESVEALERSVTRVMARVLRVEAVSGVDGVLVLDEDELDVDERDGLMVERAGVAK